MENIFVLKSAYNIMLILGSKHIKSPNFCKISSIDEIKNTKSNSFVLFAYDIETVKYCNDNNVQSAVLIDSITQAIFCNNLNVDFIIVNESIAIDIQKIAQNYMFDSKVVQIINDDNEIEKAALNEIDACIYKELI